MRLFTLSISELRPVSTARTAISRHQSPMLIKKRLAPRNQQPPNFTRSKTQPEGLAFNGQSSTCDPFKQYANVDLRTLSEWNEYEKNYQAQVEQQVRREEEKLNRIKHKRWLKVATKQPVM